MPSQSAPLPELRDHKDDSNPKHPLEPTIRYLGGPGQLPADERADLDRWLADLDRHFEPEEPGE